MPLNVVRDWLNARSRRLGLGYRSCGVVSQRPATSHLCHRYPSPWRFRRRIRVIAPNSTGRRHWKWSAPVLASRPSRAGTVPISPLRVGTNSAGGDPGPESPWLVCHCPCSLQPQPRRTSPRVNSMSWRPTWRSKSCRWQRKSSASGSSWKPPMPKPWHCRAAYRTAEQAFAASQEGYRAGAPGQLELLDTQRSDRGAQRLPRLPSSPIFITGRTDLCWP